jgi:lysophospholipase L1-like esterase
MTRLALVVALASGIAMAQGSNLTRPSLRMQLASGQGPVTIVCFGASTTGVYYHTGGRRVWCDMLGLALHKVYPLAKLEMLNAGISGDTTVDALQRIQASVLAKKPQLVVVEFLLNDVVKVSPSDYRDNLVRIVKELRSSGAEVILCTPNLIYPEDPTRPLTRVVAYVDIVRRVGAELHVTVADVYRAFEQIRSQNAWVWTTTMDDTLHPNLRGHIVVAEEVAHAITGKRVSLGEVPPLSPSIPRTLALLSRHAPLKVLAMPPFDGFIERALRQISPDARILVIPWAAKSFAEIAKESRKRDWAAMWKLKEEDRPDLVILAIPSGSSPTQREQFEAYNWMLGTSLSFAGFDWDVVPVLPSAAVVNQTDGSRKSEELAVEAIKGHDMGWIARRPGDAASVYEIVSRWLQDQERVSAAK